MSAQYSRLPAPLAVNSSQATVINAMSVDVEDYFQVAAFEEHIPFAKWSSIASRVEANTDRLLALFAKHGVNGTFFILGWVAQRYPGLVRRIVGAGHEVASHGMYHIRIFRQTPQEFLTDITASKKLLEDCSGQEIIGYRASTYSITDATVWAWEQLQEAGYRYSSSIYPVYHDLYGMPDAPRFAFYPRPGIVEIPITTISLLNQRIPCGGGGYFRLFPLVFSRWAWRRVNGGDRQPGVFYCHPWEFDPQQPRIANIGAKTRFRHYLNLQHMENRLDGMLRAFKWDRMDRVYHDAIWLEQA